MWLRFVAWVVAILVGLAVAVFAAFKLSPWPAVLLIRHTFGTDAVARNAALEKHLPEQVTELRDQRYGDGGNTLVDVYLPPNAAGPLPTVVWVHGGAFVAGDRSDLSGYLKILAARGYAAIAVGYSVAPGAHYPTPVVQTNAAIAYIVANAGRFHADPDRLVLAGDSGGAQIMAQAAAIISDQAYAGAAGIAPGIERRRIRGIALFCGIYDASAIKLDGDFGGFLRTVLWSYFGTTDYQDDPRLAEFSVSRHVTPAFPPTFISVGNADPLEPQSRLMAEALTDKGVVVDALWFASDHNPPLPHEYQFNLDGAAGEQALDRLLAFLARVTE